MKFQVPHLVGLDSTDPYVDFDFPFSALDNSTSDTVARRLTAVEREEEEDDWQHRAEDYLIVSSIPIIS